MESFKKFLSTTLGRVVVTIVSAIIIFGIFLIAIETEITILCIIIFAVCAYFGWRVLDFITPNIFLIMPIGGWILYYVIRGALSFMVGFFVAPFQIGAMVSRAVKESMNQ